MIERVVAAVVKLAFWAPLLICAWLALTPAPPGLLFSIGDVFLHVAAFSYLTFAARLAYPVRSPWTIACCMLGFGALLELLQGLTPTRAAEWGDLLMDLIGIAIGLGLFFVARPVLERVLTHQGSAPRP